MKIVGCDTFAPTVVLLLCFFIFCPGGVHGQGRQEDDDESFEDKTFSNVTDETEEEDDSTNVDTANTESDRVLSLPGFEGDFASEPKQYAGYLHEDPTSYSSLFYYFTECRSCDVSSSPLVIWLQGGPGCSSLFGFFTEMGPYKLMKLSNDSIRVYPNPYSWSESYNVLFIDQPVGTGFSTVMPNDYASSEEEVSSKLYDSVQFFANRYPEYSGSGIILMGESYAGKYVPAFAATIVRRAQEGLANEFPELRGAGIGDGYVVPSIQRPHIGARLRADGFIDAMQWEQTQFLITECERALIMRTQYSEDEHPCKGVYELPHYLAGDRLSLYDIRAWEYDNSLRETLNDYLHLSAVKSALHVQGRGNWTNCDRLVHEHMYPDQYIPTTDKITFLLQSQVPLLIYNGQFDSRDGPLGAEEWIQTLSWEGLRSFQNSPRLQWWYNDKVAGYVKERGGLTFLTVIGAGHMSPTDQPAATQSMLATFVENRSFGKDDADYVKAACSYLKDCGGSARGHCVNGRCICESPYQGVACQNAIVSLQLDEDMAVTYSSSLRPLSWEFYSMAVPRTIVDPIQFDLFLDDGGGATRPRDVSSRFFSVYLRRGKVPSKEEYHYSAHSQSAQQPEDEDSQSLTLTARLQPGPWYVGVYHGNEVTRTYNLRADVKTSQATSDGYASRISPIPSIMDDDDAPTPTEKVNKDEHDGTGDPTETNAGASPDGSEASERVSTDVGLQSTLVWTITVLSAILFLCIIIIALLLFVVVRRVSNPSWQGISGDLSDSEL